MADDQTQSAFTRRLSSRDVLALTAGVALAVVAEWRWGVGVLAWFAPIPFLYYLRHTQGWKSQLGLFVALLFASHLAVAKIITPPASFSLVPMFALPAAMAQFIIYFLWNLGRRRAGEAWAIYAFPSLMVVAEWMQHALNEFGVWGTVANTQLYDLPLMQCASLLGFSAVSFLVAWGASLAEQLFASRDLTLWRWHIAAFAVVWVGAMSFGSIRLDRQLEGPHVQVAAVTADFIFQDQLPGDEQAQQLTATLFLRSTKAAQQGAQIVVWNEAATTVKKSDEPEFLRRAGAWAKEHRVHLVAAYAVPVNDSSPQFENKYVWLRPDATVAQTYLKHHPVPGEPIVANNEPMTAVDAELGRFGGAIGYDHDFPSMARALSQLGVGLVVVPASDWRGIDPIHAEMARLRAIEGGFSLLCVTRLGLSVGFDALGRIRGSLPYFENNDRILVTALPVQPIHTVYRTVGNLLVYACFAYLFFVASFLAWRLQRQMAQTGTR